MDEEKYLIRHVAPEDIAEISAAMDIAEGYEVSDALKGSLQETQQTVRGYVDHPKRFGFVVTHRFGAEIVGFFLAELRNRLTDEFEDHSIIDELDVDLFPASGEFCEIFDLWVASPHRRRGLAMRLKIHLEDYLRHRDCWSIYTHTEASNAAILNLNKKLGYHNVRTGPIWDHIPRVSLMKSLES